MSSLNEVRLIGRVGKDPEVRFAQSGTAFANFSLATSEKWTDKNTGEKKELTEWSRCSAFGKLAEIIGEYVKKGSLIYVGGRLRTEEWEDKDGIKRSTTKIIVDQMRLLSARTDDQGERQQSSQGRPQQSSRPAQSSSRPAQREAPPPDDFEEEDLPF